MLLDNSIMGAFGGVLDWQAEKLSFKNSTCIIPATHRRFRLPTPTPADAENCSLVVQNGGYEPTPVYLTRKFCLPAQSEALLEVHTTVEPPAESVPAVIEPRIISADEVTSSETPEAFHRVAVARTVCQ